MGGGGIGGTVVGSGTRYGAENLKKVAKSVVDGESPDIDMPPAPSPEPTAVPGAEDEAKNMIKGRYGRRRPGREATILAGKLVSQQGKTLLGE